MLVNLGVCISLVTIGFCCYDSRDSKKPMTLTLVQQVELKGCKFGRHRIILTVDVIFRNSNFLKSLSHRIDESYIKMNSICKYIAEYTIAGYWKRPTIHMLISVSSLTSPPCHPPNSNDFRKRSGRNAGVPRSCWLRWGPDDPGLPWRPTVDGSEIRLTLPETNKNTCQEAIPKRKVAFKNHHFWGAMLVSGRVTFWGW